jgi:hypothetical protein
VYFLAAPLPGRYAIDLTYFLHEHCTLDCPAPDQAMSYWRQYLQDYETQYWDEPTQWTVERGAKGNHPENFAFAYNEILFVGINLVGGAVHNETEWATRQAANLKWIDNNFAKHKDGTKAFVLFAHADPDVPSNNAFYEPFKDRVKTEYSQIPVVLIHRNLGVEPWSWETQFENIPNLSVIVVAGSVWPPLMGAVDFRQSSPLIFDQSNWYDQYIQHQTSQKENSQATATQETEATQTQATQTTQNQKTMTTQYQKTPTTQNQKTLTAQNQKKNGKS